MEKESIDRDTGHKNFEASNTKGNSIDSSNYSKPTLKLSCNTNISGNLAKLQQENLKLIKDIEEKKIKNNSIEKTHAILMIEQNYYLHILDNISQVVQMEPNLTGIRQILDANPEELENLVNH